MIRVIVELVPHGKEEDKIKLAIGEIANNLKGTLKYGSYNYIFHYKSLDNKPMISSGVITNHKRSDNVLTLLKNVLSKIV
jgi:hypothetical protein